ncbi:LacI family transcriptional regulator [Streptococcus bovimastitidis]|uniref:LacI family transcriptional regulator n=1 Tax=Streptococcus bovimastitidis TaxID=1856638 RepID=A0A1L8ML32_9STRE|nr:LacI family DNA-binding transcriptional regulator [Streptococcus bovimastitidis]OJF71436.1 LacI family transcriptional regulator [Streptococcus bovimastitidis]
MIKKSYTMKDVAKQAGVSVGTVSRVINHEQGIKKVTLEKVNKAIKELNYVPDNYARGMKTNRTETVALIVPTIWHPFFSEFAFYVEKELSQINYKLLLCNTDGFKKEVEYINMLQQNKVDGIIAITYSPIEDYLNSNIPFVSIDRSYGSKDIPWVSSDNFSGGQKAAQVLLENNCKNLLFVGSHNKTDNETKNRRNGFESFLKEKDVIPRVFDLEEPFDDFVRPLTSYLENHLDIDGIFAINDFTALDVIDILEKLGKKVPKDVQVIGYDGIKLANEKSYPISTIKQPLKEMAKEAVRILLSIIENEPHKLQVTLPISFIDGPTTKK